MTTEQQRVSSPILSISLGFCFLRLACGRAAGRFQSTHARPATPHAAARPPPAPKRTDFQNPKKATALPCPAPRRRTDSTSFLTNGHCPHIYERRWTPYSVVAVLTHPCAVEYFYLCDQSQKKRTNPKGKAKTHITASRIKTTRAHAPSFWAEITLHITTTLAHAHALVCLSRSLLQIILYTYVGPFLHADLTQPPRGLID